MVLVVFPTGSRDRVRVLGRISRLNPDVSGLELQKQPAADWRSLVQTAGIGDKADFRLPADQFSLVNQWVHEGVNISFTAEKSFFLTETMVSASYKILGATDTTVSVTGTIVFANEKIFSMAENIVSVWETFVFGTEKIFSVTEKIFSIAETIFSVSKTTFSALKRSFRRRRTPFLP